MFGLHMYLNYPLESVPDHTQKAGPAFLLGWVQLELLHQYMYTK